MASLELWVESATGWIAREAVRLDAAESKALVASGWLVLTCDRECFCPAALAVEVESSVVVSRDSATLDLAAAELCRFVLFRFFFRGVTVVALWFRCGQRPLEPVSP